MHRKVRVVQKHIEVYLIEICRISKHRRTGPTRLGGAAPCLPEKSCPKFSKKKFSFLKKRSSIVYCPNFGRFARILDRFAQILGRFTRIFFETGGLPPPPPPRLVRLCIKSRKYVEFLALHISAASQKPSKFR